jgi:AraC family transcriptional regulator, activator of mtrCDE
MSADERYDALSALAPLLRVRPELQSLCRFGMSWASPHAREPRGWAPFHLVTAGMCFLQMNGAEPVALNAGDIVVLPHGDPHVVYGSSDRRGKMRSAEITVQETSTIQIKSNSDTPDTELICGRLTFEQPHENLVRAALPPMIVLKTAEDASVHRLRDLLLAIREELDFCAPGAQAICCDLASALLVMVLRVHFQRAALHSGLLKLLGQRGTARAVAAMLEDPGRVWTLDDIAAKANMSRATLVREFRKQAETTPLAFLTELRLCLARHSLANSNQSLGEIAENVGYQSQSAFSRAFQRHFHISPGEARLSRP